MSIDALIFLVQMTVFFMFNEDHLYTIMIIKLRETFYKFDYSNENIFFYHAYVMNREHSDTIDRNVHDCYKNS